MPHLSLTRLGRIGTAVSAALIMVSCGGGGSVTDIGGLSVRFTPDQTVLPADSVSLREGPSLGDTMTLEVWGEDIALPTFIATFGIRFEPAVVEFVDFEPGDFFEQQAPSTNVEYTVPTPLPGAGRLNVEIKKFGTPLGSQQDGVLVKLRFRVVMAGATGLEFADAILASENGGAAQGVTWLGGRLEGF
ncbi:MAG: hypothetical protein AB1451_01625 [Nitrospirota bacterium]